MILMNGIPPDTTYACHPSGLMKMEVFSQWFDSFAFLINSSKDVPVLLLLDGHLSHTNNFSVHERARKNHVAILCFP